MIWDAISDKKIRVGIRVVSPLDEHRFVDRHDCFQRVMLTNNQSQLTQQTSILMSKDVTNLW